VVGSPQGIALLHGQQPVVVFAPHFVGLDAGWTALTCPAVLGSSKAFATIYTDQSNKVVDAWILQGRQRFASASVHGRLAGVQPVLATLKAGGALYLLPDMDFGPDGAVFAPLFGQSAATVTSLSRFARLGRAQVVSVAVRLVDSGYEVDVSAPWPDFPSVDLQADTERMNRELETLIAANPSQYWWLHKRFKTRPPGKSGLY
jgi:Kdo2-lipid IVA lauroyltransferase/acyltransferase